MKMKNSPRLGVFLPLFFLWITLSGCSLFETDPEQELREQNLKRMQMHQERMQEYQVSMEKNRVLMQKNLDLMEPYRLRAEQYKRSMEQDQKLVNYHKELMEEYQGRLAGRRPTTPSPIGAQETPIEIPEEEPPPDVLDTKDLESHPLIDDVPEVAPKTYRKDDVQHYVIPF